MTSQRDRGNVLSHLGIDRFSAIYLWMVIILVFGFVEPRLFLTQGTLHSVAAAQAIPGIMALGLLIPMSAGAYDLSIGATANLTAILVVVLINRGMDLWIAILLSILVAVVVGLVNGLLVVKFRINSFIATLGTASIIAAVQTIISGDSQPSSPTSSAWSSLTQTSVFGFEVVVVYMLLLAVIVWWFVEHTPAGRYLRAIGGNAEAARLSGLAVGRWTWLSLVISATLCGMAGILYSSQSGPGVSFGSALLLPAFAAVFLGSTQIRPGRFNVWGTLLAIYVLASGVQGLQLLTGVQWLSEMFNGVALVVAVGFAVWGEGRSVARLSRKPAEYPGSAELSPRHQIPFGEQENGDVLKDTSEKVHEEEGVRSIE